MLFLSLSLTPSRSHYPAILHRDRIQVPILAFTELHDKVKSTSLFKFAGELTKKDKICIPSCSNTLRAFFKPRLILKFILWQRDTLTISDYYTFSGRLSAEPSLLHIAAPRLLTREEEKNHLGESKVTSTFAVRETFAVTFMGRR